MKQKKPESAPLEQRLEAVKKEYESVLKEQRERILLLREDNASLAERVERLEAQKEEVVSVLVDAKEKANAIISDANKKAQSILNEAQLSKKEMANTISYYNRSLKELETRCEQILYGISNALEQKKRTPFNIMPASNQ